MRCEELREWISAELDGEAGPAEREVVRQHLAVCVTCRQARAAAAELRERLAGICPGAADPDRRDEPLFAMLRRDGVIREQGTTAGLMDRLQRAWIRRIIEGAAGWGPSLRPALATLAVSFLLTWGSLRWAERSAGRNSENRPAATASMAARKPAADVLERWLDGPPILAPLAQLQPPAPPRPPFPRLRQRSDRGRPRGRVG